MGAQSTTMQPSPSAASSPTTRAPASSFRSLSPRQQRVRARCAVGRHRWRHLLFCQPLYLSVTATVNLRAADKSLSADTYSVYVSWGHWRVPETDADLPSDFPTLPIDPPPPSLRNGGYMEDLKSRD
ncbi:hypothetical protein BU23DRAFT_561013 [Bimuria novae-zelandiae CBS 107.79]|uniref:Uncharacterized protein n=1 Tax=Bimuria novae-zelandiae CBS 107.79 TaxID=1447943 RepID=A0A6A5UP33_9PLEO|nr:hypothetical protein BU23DRAFT_561013 [Bimuria novae-zelandiae CBS 107.79]